MWRERLIRFLLVGLAAILILGVTEGLVGRREKRKAAGKTISLPTEQIGEKIENVGENVLGRVIKILPRSEKLEEKIKEEEEQEKGEGQKETKRETIKIIETQTKEIIEIIKKMPADQVKQIKRQIFKEFCQEILIEE